MNDAPRSLTSQETPSFAPDDFFTEAEAKKLANGQPAEDDHDLMRFDTESPAHG